MTKRYDDVIEVTPDPHDDSAPLAFSWRGHRYRIDQRLATWREAGEWWAGSRSRNGTGTSTRDREYFRVLARPAEALATGDLDPDGYLRGTLGAVYDVYRDRTLGTWRLVRIWD